MLRRSLILIIAALVFASLLTYGLSRWLEGARTRSRAAQLARDKARQKRDVLVATRNIPIGTQLKAADVTWQEWPIKLVSPQYWIRGVRSRSNIVGSIIKTPVHKGQPVVDGYLIPKSHAGDLSYHLKPGMRAISIDTKAGDSVAGFLIPGNYVDIILTYQVGGPPPNIQSNAAQTSKQTQGATFSRGQTRGARPNRQANSEQVTQQPTRFDKTARVSKTIVSKVLVLGIDQVTTVENKKKDVIYKTVTLEVSTQASSSHCACQALRQTIINSKKHQRYRAMAPNINRLFQAN